MENNPNKPAGKVPISLIVNGEHTEISFALHKTLLEVLQEDIGLTGRLPLCHPWWPCIQGRLENPDSDDQNIEEL